MVELYLFSQGNVTFYLNHECERMWKEVIVLEFKVLFRNLIRGTKENTANL
jgi:hypothetical protein